MTGEAEGDRHCRELALRTLSIRSRFPRIISRLHSKDDGYIKGDQFPTHLLISFNGLKTLHSQTNLHSPTSSTNPALALNG